MKPGDHFIKAAHVLTRDLAFALTNFQSPEKWTFHHSELRRHFSQASLETLKGLIEEIKRQNTAAGVEGFYKPRFTRAARRMKQVLASMSDLHPEPMVEFERSAIDIPRVCMWVNENICTPALAAPVRTKPSLTLYNGGLEADQPRPPSSVQLKAVL